jgi:HAD superfamily hydrolase (TIGR01509 family)
VSVRGVLFDVDGTLVDSNRAHAQAWHDAFEEVGLDGGDVERILTLIGMGSDKLLPAAVGIDKDSPEGQRLAKRHKAVFLERYLPKVKATPGAADLVRVLRDRGLELGVATSAEPDELRALLRKVDAEWLVDRAASSKDVKASKPEPDVVVVALERLGLPRDEVVLIGDTPYDVEASRRAGIAVIALRCGGWSDDALQGADAIYQDPADLLAHLDSSPLGR